VDNIMDKSILTGFEVMGSFGVSYYLTGMTTSDSAERFNAQAGAAVMRAHASCHGFVTPV
jgi:hypothetical protein